MPLILNNSRGVPKLLSSLGPEVKQEPSPYIKVYCQFHCRNWEQDLIPACYKAKCSFPHSCMQDYFRHEDLGENTNHLPKAQKKLQFGPFLWLSCDWPPVVFWRQLFFTNLWGFLEQVIARLYLKSLTY